MALYTPRYTVAKLDQFPDDGNRYELLSGQLFVTPSPSSGHQGVIARLAALFAQHVLAGAVGLFAPGVVRVSFDTQLEPDLLLTTPTFMPGMPWEQCHDHWLAVEVLSPSSRVYDREHKCATYLDRGVREVWLIDIDARTSSGATAGSTTARSTFVPTPNSTRVSNRANPMARARTMYTPGAMARIVNRP
ncbi:MAG: Uma2 family endonuclease, partial [Gemmatimonadaceae bacterium]